MDKRVDQRVDATLELETAFQALRAALDKGDLDGFYGLIDEDAVIFDEDNPFRLTKAGFAEHISFHGPATWDSYQWYPRDVHCRVFGDTGVVAGTVTFRGKPVDAGFRQRHMLFSQGWTRRDGAWRLITWHQSPLDGHIIEASPS